MGDVCLQCLEPDLEGLRCFCVEDVVLVLVWDWLIRGKTEGEL